MNPGQALKAHHLAEALRKVHGLHSDQKFEEALDPIHEALRSPELRELDALTDLRWHFRYAEGVSLDMVGQSEKALEIFAELVKKFPGMPQFEASLLICCERLEREAATRLETNPADPKVRSILGICQQHGLPSYWLIHAVASQEASEGSFDRAWQRMKDLLALSPNDHDYLRCALSLATVPELRKERAELVAHVRRLWEAQPYRTELAELLCSEGHGERACTRGA